MRSSPLDSTTLLQNLQTGVVVHADSSEILYANPKALELLRLTEAQAFGKDAFDPQWKFLNSRHEVMTLDQFPVMQVLNTKQKISHLEVGICDGSSDKVTWVLCNAYPEFSSDKSISQIVVTFIDITAQKNEISFENIVELASDVIVVTEAYPVIGTGPKITYVNKAFSELTGYSKEEAIGKTPRILQREDVGEATRIKIREALEKNEPVQTEILNYSKNGQAYWLDMHIFPLKNQLDEVTHFVGIERDITNQKNHETKLKELSIRDPLTALLNRRGFFEVAQSHITKAKRNYSPSSIIMVDIDNFKKINDQYGHDIGDRALINISKLMTAFFRESDIIGRLGGEEFSILLSHSDLDSAITKLNQFRLYLAENPLCMQNSPDLAITISAGATNIPRENQGISEVLKKADMALYEAKSLGRDQVRYSRT